MIENIIITSLLDNNLRIQYQPDQPDVTSKAIKTQIMNATDDTPVLYDLQLSSAKVCSTDPDPKMVPIK